MPNQEKPPTEEPAAAAVEAKPAAEAKPAEEAPKPSPEAPKPAEEPQTAPVEVVKIEPEVVTPAHAPAAEEKAPEAPAAAAPAAPAAEEKVSHLGEHLLYFSYILGAKNSVREQLGPPFKGHAVAMTSHDP